MREPMTQEEYVENEGGSCPACRSEEIQVEVDFNQSNLRTLVQTGDCLTCGASWDQFYHLAGYSSLTQGETPPED